MKTVYQVQCQYRSGDPWTTFGTPTSLAIARKMRRLALVLKAKAARIVKSTRTVIET